MFYCMFYYMLCLLFVFGCVVVLLCVYGVFYMFCFIVRFCRFSMCVCWGGLGCVLVCFMVLVIVCFMLCFTVGLRVRALWWVLLYVLLCVFPNFL